MRLCVVSQLKIPTLIETYILMSRKSTLPAYYNTVPCKSESVCSTLIILASVVLLYYHSVITSQVKK